MCISQKLYSEAIVSCVALFKKRPYLGEKKKKKRVNFTNSTSTTQDTALLREEDHPAHENKSSLLTQKLLAASNGELYTCSIAPYDIPKITAEGSF